MIRRPVLVAQMNMGRVRWLAHHEVQISCPLLPPFQVKAERACTLCITRGRGVVKCLFSDFKKYRRVVRPASELYEISLANDRGLVGFTQECKTLGITEYQLCQFCMPLPDVNLYIVTSDNR